MLAAVKNARRITNDLSPRVAGNTLECGIDVLNGAFRINEDDALVLLLNGRYQAGTFLLGYLPQRGPLQSRRFLR